MGHAKIAADLFASFLAKLSFIALGFYLELYALFEMNNLLDICSPLSFS